MEKEIRGDDWDEKKKGFEQHMLEKDTVRERWRSGAFEGKESCRNCNNENAWSFTSQCCQKQCHEKLNALQGTSLKLLAYEELLKNYPTCQLLPSNVYLSRL